MAVFVTNLKRLRLVKEHAMDDVLNGIVVRKLDNTLEFGEDGKYSTDDKSEIEWLRNHPANAHNLKRTNTKFFELDFKESDYEPKPIKEKAKASL